MRLTIRLSRSLRGRRYTWSMNRATLTTLISLPRRIGNTSSNSADFWWRSFLNFR